MSHAPFCGSQRQALSCTVLLRRHQPDSPSLAVQKVNDMGGKVMAGVNYCAMHKYGGPASATSRRNCATTLKVWLTRRCTMCSPAPLFQAECVALHHCVRQPKSTLTYFSLVSAAGAGCTGSRHGHCVQH